MIIYRIVRKSDGKGYTGQTTWSLEDRIKGHLRERTNCIINNALRKDGLAEFHWYRVCRCYSREELNEKEKYYIKHFGDKNPTGFNLTDGGEGSHGWHPSEETRRKISENHADISGEKNPTKRPEVRKKISKAKKGKKRPDMAGENALMKRPGVKEKMISTFKSNLKNKSKSEE